MITTLSEFNAAPPDAEIDLDALIQEFDRSGIPALDSLWSKAYSSHRQRQRAAAVLVDLTRRMGKERKADLVRHLAIRLPLAIAHGNRLKNQNAARLISSCLFHLNFQNTYGETGYTPQLKTHFAEILRVIEWWRNHVTLNKEYVYPAIYFARELLDENMFFHAANDAVEGVRRVYELLDRTLDPVDFDETLWFELYGSCRDALGYAHRGSRVRSLAANMPDLTEAFRKRLEQAAGERIAAALLSGDRDEIWQVAREGFAADSGNTLFRFLAAYDLRPSAVGSYSKDDPGSLLNIALEANNNWKQMYDIIEWFYRQELSLTDAQRAALIRYMAKTGALPEPRIVSQALAACAKGGLPETYNALRGMIDAQETGTPDAYLEMLKGLKLRLFVLDATRFMNGLLERGPKAA